METMIDNLINGNLKTAKAQAKRFSLIAIKNHLTELQWSDAKTYAAAVYLKTGEGFQDYCDIDN